MVHVSTSGSCIVWRAAHKGAATPLLFWFWRACLSSCLASLFSQLLVRLELHGLALGEIFLDYSSRLVLKDLKITNCQLAADKVLSYPDPWNILKSQAVNSVGNLSQLKYLLRVWFHYNWMTILVKLLFLKACRRWKQRLSSLAKTMTSVFFFEAC
jgi:hypothetical protein